MIMWLCSVQNVCALLNLRTVGTEGGVAPLDGAVGGVVVGGAWSGCCRIYNKDTVTSDMVGMKGCGRYLDVCVACTWWRW